MYIYEYIYIYIYIYICIYICIYTCFTLVYAACPSDVPQIEIRLDMGLGGGTGCVSMWGVLLGMVGVGGGSTVQSTDTIPIRCSKHR